MTVGAEFLPNNVGELQRMIVQMAAEQDEKIELLQSQIESERSERIEYQNKALEYFEELQQMRRRLFGRSAERLPEEDRRQLWLFNEVELIASGGDPRPKSSEERVAVRAHTRLKRGCKPLPADLPRLVQIHDIAEEDKRCGCGAELTQIGEEACEKLEIIPAKVQVRRHVRPKYACQVCEGSGDEDKPAVRIAPAVSQLLPKSIASPALVSYMIVSKFCDALPFYRQERQFQRMGVDISRQDMANWTLKVFDRINPLLELLRRQILGGSAIGIDETTLQVMGEEGRANTSKSFMWVYIGGTQERPVVEYQYHPSRSGKIPLAYLKGYRGYIQTDGYDGYNELGRQHGIEHAGCWAHVRRGFFEAKVISKQTGSADEALGRIDKIFAIERALREEDLESERFLEQRRTAVEPILEKLRSWLESRQPQVPPSTLLGKAIGYALDQWHKLIRYLESPYLHPDNNACERAIRPFVIGRKNWVLSGSPAGATASAGWYSIIESSKLNGVEPYLYLRYILSHLPDTPNAKGYQALLPWNIKKESLLDFDSSRLY
jgi:transposase